MINHIVTIGEAAGRTGVKVPTIRYYEQVGLLPVASRTAGNHRHFSSDDIRRLLFIRKARELGFPIASVRSLLHLRDRPDESCSDAHRIARLRLQEITRRIEGLARLRVALEAMMNGCSDGVSVNCRVLDAIADSPARSATL